MKTHHKTPHVKCDECASPPRPPLDRLRNIFSQLIADHESGYAPLSLPQLLQLKAAFDADRPSAYMVLTTLTNQMTFASDGYDGDAANLPIILDFLAQFQRRVAEDLLATERRIPEGLKMAV